ncbi:MAG: lysophospholipase [Candidatus Omnitrophica bacterium]|nr:lysophospholipase [Candidatus Omnitrophota bacterium]MBU4488453.1 lysophospholipase [Candidatus Omnitrophota bacterium]MCG2705649.1 lysophospholipase [Candidatus Omnitrophota bacterium]
MKESLGQYAARDGKMLNFRKWPGPDDVIVYLHGIESNSGWFSSFASQLAESGFTLYGIDRRGSGLNYENRGDIKDYNIFLDDIEDAVSFVKKENPAKRVYIMGICWGAFLAVNYSINRHSNPDGLILLSPAIYRKVDFKAGPKIAARACSLVYPKAYFKIPIKDRMFTDNSRYLDFIRSDKMRLGSLTCRFFKEILRMENDFAFKSNELFLPVLVLLAGHDEIVDNRKIHNWFDSLPAEDKTIKTFTNFHHVMPFEEDTSPILDAISGWIKKRKVPLAVQSIKN